MGNTEGWTYDFFTPQPVTGQCKQLSQVQSSNHRTETDFKVGARFYFLHYILHNWTDSTSVRILKSTASGIKKGYSKLDWNECILLNAGCPLFQAAVDIQLMISFEEMERTQSQWKDSSAVVLG